MQVWIHFVSCSSIHLSWIDSKLQTCLGWEFQVSIGLARTSRNGQQKNDINGAWLLVNLLQNYRRWTLQNIGHADLGICLTHCDLIQWHQTQVVFSLPRLSKESHSSPADVKVLMDSTLGQQCWLQSSPWRKSWNPWNPEVCITFPLTSSLNWWCIMVMVNSLVHQIVLEEMWIWCQWHPCG